MWRKLLFTKDDELDLGWLLTGLLCVVGCAGFLYEIHNNGKATLEGYTFVGYALTNLLIAAVPIAKARLLNSRDKMNAGTSETSTTTVTEPSTENKG